MRPLLLVHGITSSARRTFGVPGRVLKHPKPNSMFGFLLNLGYQPGITLFWYSYPTLMPLLKSAQRLQEEIASVQTVSGSREIDLLTFSLGGIIAKYYIISPLYREEISKLVMIAPPFLGSPRANLYKTEFHRTGKDLLFPGDSRGFSPQILSSNHPLLKELAHYPFPPGIETAIIAMKLIMPERGNLLSRYQRFIGAHIGDGDLTVPVVSTQINVNRHYLLADDYSPRKTHGFLPNHPAIQGIIQKELMSGYEYESPGCQIC